MRRRLWLAALCLLAFALSWGYVHHYLRGGPRIIDATSYFLEARSLAAGSFSFNVPDPTAAFRGRFLLSSHDGHRLGVIFPPGYPLLLSLGMRLGVPLLVGPALGALLVAATYALARALGQTTKVAGLAAGLSAICAALRYHTADTMSHGLATLLACAALTLALRRDLRFASVFCGVSLGVLVATRPVSAAVSCLLVGYVLRRLPRVWPAVLIGALPGVALLLAQQHALTGHFLDSTQLAYYSAADAPTGCFRYGFGAGVGCRFEHGDYVSRFLPNGFGAAHALRNFIVRFVAFATDATNAWPLTLLAGAALAKNARSPLAILGAGIVLQGLAYVPFYFDGDYAGGGARFLCEAIPFCQILVARAACDLRVGWLTLPVSVGGFALYAHRGHDELGARDGGRPMFEPAVLSKVGVASGLVFVGTDHGFNLGYDPRVRNAATGLVVARGHGDAHDRQLYELLGRPRAYRYVFDLKAQTAPRLVPYTPAASSRLEAEAEWPALLERGHAYPIHFPCASQSRALRLLPGTRAFFPSIWPAEVPGELDVGWVSTGRGADLRIGWSGSDPQRLSVTGPGCSILRVPGRPPGSHSALSIELVSGEGALDFLEPG